MHIAIWIIAALTLGLWSLLSWGVAAVLGMDPTWVGNLQPLVANIPYADLIETWVPGWQAMMVSLVHLVQSLLGWLGGAGMVVVWVLWAVGAVFIAGTAAVLSMIVVLVRKSSRSAPTPPNSPAAA